MNIEKGYQSLSMKKNAWELNTEPQAFYGSILTYYITLSHDLGDQTDQL